MTDEIDRAVDQHPPVVGVLTLGEQVDPRLDRDFGAALDQLASWSSVSPSKMLEWAEVLDPHHIVAR